MAEVVLDGGMGPEPGRGSGAAPVPVRASEVMGRHRGPVRAVGGDCFANGATVAMTGTCAVHRDRFEGVALGGRIADLKPAAVARPGRRLAWLWQTR